MGAEDNVKTVQSVYEAFGRGDVDGILAARPHRRRRWRGPYDDRMKRITVSLPDDLVERIKFAAGGEGQVSSYVATALADYQEREGLAELLAAWRSETPIADDVRRQVAAELDEVGLTESPTRRGRQTG